MGYHTWVQSHFPGTKVKDKKSQNAKFMLAPYSLFYKSLYLFIPIPIMPPYPLPTDNY